MGFAKESGPKKTVVSGLFGRRNHGQQGINRAKSPEIVGFGAKRDWVCAVARLNKPKPRV